MGDAEVAILSAPIIELLGQMHTCGAVDSLVTAVSDAGP